MSRKLLGIGLGLAFITACGVATSNDNQAEIQEAWNAQNDPVLMAPRTYMRLVNNLPLKASLPAEKRPWSDTYWPTKEGGINSRWASSTESDPFKYKVHTKEELKAMTPAQIEELSPAEKYDIYMGRYADYPLVNYERKRTKPTAESWEGLCHGWAPAALIYREPAAVEVTNPDGIKIKFNSADVKALLTFFEGEMARGKTKFLGARCNADFTKTPSAKNTPECTDTNAGAFHLILANEIGIAKRGFVFDRTVDQQVWNQPVWGYDSAVLNVKDGASIGAAAGTVREITLQTSVYYANEIHPMKEPVLGTENQLDDREVYKYRLEINAKGEIIGGAWITDARPDFLWSKKQTAFSGYFTGLSKIYQPVKTPANR